VQQNLQDFICITPGGFLDVDADARGCSGFGGGLQEAGG
jgi:hypothetical protein